MVRTCVLSAAVRRVFRRGWLLVLLAPQVLAANPVVDFDIEFAAALIQENYPEYAEAVVEDLLRKHPADETILERTLVIRAQSLIARRRFDEAEVLLETLPTDSPRAEAIRLAIADGHFLAGNPDASAAIYDAFFARYAEETPSDPDLLRFFGEAAYQYAQMLIQRDDADGAARAYGQVLRAIGDADEELLRKIKVERSELLLRAAAALPPGPEREERIDPAIAHCREILWGGMDLWFGRAVICLAQSYLLREETAAAMDLLQTNLRMLRTVDGMLREADMPLADSPLAGARSLLAGLYAAEADLLTGPAGPREAMALTYFERALTAFRAVWNVMLSANRRDAQWLQRNPGKTVADLAVAHETSGAGIRRADRQAPFNQLSEALGSFRRQVQTAPGAAGWDSANRERADALLAAIDGMSNAVRTNRTASVGVSPTREMELGDRFEGQAHLTRATLFLADAEARRTRAIERYTQALQHDYHVFIHYSGSPWARESGPRSERMKARLEELTGQTVTIDIGADSQQRRGLALITEGRNLFRRNEYEAAAERLAAGLNIRPEGDHALGALANLLECYARLDRALHVRMLVEYIGERFADTEQAPRTLLRIGRFYFDREEPAMFLDVYERYLRLFPTHYMAATILFMLGEQRWAEQEYDGAAAYYNRVVSNYPQSAEFLRALNRIGWSHYLQGRHAESAAIFRQVVERAPHGMVRAEAKICLADSLRQTGFYAEAVTQYRELNEWLTQPDSVYLRTATARDQTERLREQALFYEAHCLSRITTPEDEVADARAAAVERFRAFVTAFPRSDLAPLALGSMGAVLLADDRPDAAAAIYDELARDYAESEAGRDARFAMIRSLLDIGQTRRAGSELDGMIEEAGRYSARQFLRLGTLFFEARDPENAVRALDQALAKRDEPDTDASARDAVEQRARFLLGQAHHSLRNYDAAIVHLRHLIDHFPTSALFFEARFLLGKTLQSMDRPEEAIEVLHDVFRQASEQDLINRATLELGALQAALGRTKDALASFQRIVLLEDPESPAIRPIYSQALARSVGLFAELAQWNEVVESADRYLDLFPTGPDAVDVRTWRVQGVMQRGGDAGGVR